MQPKKKPGRGARGLDFDVELLSGKFPPRS
jgi:hypothetical protein